VTASLLAGFALGWIGSMPIAGAVSIFIVHRGLAGRLRDGLRLAAGAGIAEALWCAAVSLGAGRLFERWPTLEAVAELCGGFILVGLGVYFLRRAPRPVRSEAEPGAQRAPGNFRLGFALVMFNASVPVNWLVLQAIVQSLGLDRFTRSPGALAAGVALGIFGWFTFLLLCLDSLRGRFTPAVVRRLGRGMGALLVVCGLVVLGRQLT